MFYDPDRSTYLSKLLPLAGEVEGKGAEAGTDWLLSDQLRMREELTACADFCCRQMPKVGRVARFIASQDGRGVDFVEIETVEGNVAYRPGNLFWMSPARAAAMYEKLAA